MRRSGDGQAACLSLVLKVALLTALLSASGTRGGQGTIATLPSDGGTAGGANSSSAAGPVPAASTTAQNGGAGAGQCGDETWGAVAPPVTGSADFGSGGPAAGPGPDAASGLAPAPSSTPEPEAAADGAAAAASKPPAEAADTTAAPAGEPLAAAAAEQVVAGAEQAAGQWAVPAAEAEQQQAAVQQADAVPAVHEEQHHNFALAKEGAKVLAANKEAKKAQALLDDDSDTFLKNDCRAADKWVILELSQVAKVSRLELAQYELYSARVKEFSVHGRQSHPRTDGVGAEYARSLDSPQWKPLGEFTAEKAKGSQLFTMEQPRWVRYLLLRFLTQHGPEPVCAVNGVAVFGKSAVEELEDQLAAEEGLGFGALHAELAAPTAEAVLAAPPGTLDDPTPDTAVPAAAATAATAQAGAGAGAGAAVPVPSQAAESGQPVAHQQAPVTSPPVVQGQADAPAQQAEQAPHHQAGHGDVGTQAAAGMPVAAAAPDGAAPAAQAQPASGAEPDGAQQQPAADQDAGAGAGGSSGGSSTSSQAGGEPGGSGGAQAAAVGDGSAVSVPAAAGGTCAAELAAPDACAAAPDQQATPPGGASSEAGSAASEGAVTDGPVAADQPAQVQQAASADAGGRAAARPAGTDTAAGPASAGAAAGGPAASAAQATPQLAEPAAAAAPRPGVPASPGIATGPAAASPASTGASSAAAAASSAALPEELDLPLTGLTAKGKGGGSVYDILVQEIKTAKLQHKLLAKSVVDLQRNASAQYAELQADLASLAATLAKLPADHNVSDVLLAARVDLMVKAHLLQVSTQMLGLQAALASAAKQQHALLCFLAMVGSMLALNGTRFADQWPRAKWAVLLLAAANGLVGVGLQLQGGMARPPAWLPALP